MMLSEWKDLAAVLGTLFAAGAVVFTVYKGLEELKKNREQRERDLKLKRVEFTLAQHRRLFDDADLNSVLRILDGDQAGLADPKMWDPKRKFLTFLEELCLLVNDGLIDKDVAHYMFGYYAATAFAGENFKIGMAWEARYWGLFFEFAQEATERLASDSKAPYDFKKLKF